MFKGIRVGVLTLALLGGIGGVTVATTQPADAYVASVRHTCPPGKTKPYKALKLASGPNGTTQKGKSGIQTLKWCSGSSSTVPSDVNSFYIPAGYKARVNYKSSGGKRFVINSWSSGGRWYNTSLTGSFATTRTYDVQLVPK